jgi:prevent-host-death family protein
MTVSEARAKFADVVDNARTRHEPVMLTRHGRRVAAVIDADDLDALVAAAEDLADLTEARRAREEMAETGDAPIPWDDIKADLGLT